MVRLFRAVLMVFLISICVTGCSGSKKPPTPLASHLPAGAGAAADDEIVLPIDSYGLTLAQSDAIDRARDVLIGRCMTSFGFAYDENADLADHDRAAADQVRNFGAHGNLRRYGVISTDAAQRYGYHLPSSLRGAPPSRTSGHGLGSITAAMRSVLIGSAAGSTANGRVVPAGGCVRRADTTIAGSLPVGQSPVVAKIRADSFHDSSTDPAVRRAVGKWSACMAEHGYRWSDPTDAGTDVDINTSTVTPPERTEAMTDVACKQSTDLVAIWFRAEVTYQMTQIRDQSATLAAVLRANAVQLANVAAVLRPAP